MNILSARFANADKTAVVIDTDSDGNVAISARDRPDLWAKLQTWIGAGGTPDAYVAPPVPAPSFLVRDFLRLLQPADRGRVSIALQAEMTQATEAAQGGGDPNMPLRLIWDQMMAQGEAPISTDKPEFAAEWQSLANAIGPDRAAEIAALLKIA